MTDIAQELMTPNEAAKWFRRSTSWLRHQPEIIRVAGPGGQPLYHVDVCRAYTLAKMCGLKDAELRRVQVEALAAACHLLHARPWDELAAAIVQPPLPVIADETASGESATLAHALRPRIETSR